MNWIKFSFWLVGIYMLYYVVLICWDQWKEGKTASLAEENELSFVDQVVPQKVGAMSVPDRSVSPVISSGGVTLRQMFNLAQQEAIEFTRPVSFA